MVGSGSGHRSKEAVGMMALHQALRTLCLNTDWTYSVFWTIRPRSRLRGGNGCKVGDDNGSLMLMWEDGFCKGRDADCLEEIDGEDPLRKAFSKMSIQLYNYGEGLMGKVASDKCHKWVFKEATECEPNISNYWQSSFDSIPPEWSDQFDSGIQTITVIQAGHGLLQLGSCKIIAEDLHFVLRMRHTFESLGHESGFYLSQLFSSNRSNSSLPSPPHFNWSQRPLPPPTNPMLGFPQPKDMMVEHENDIKWPNGLSFFNALTAQSDDAKPLLNSESLGNKSETNHHPFILEGKDSNPNELLSLDSHPDNMRKFKVATSSSLTWVDHHQHQNGEYRNPEPGMYTDVME